MSCKKEEVIISKCFDTTGNVVADNGGSETTTTTVEFNAENLNLIQGGSSQGGSPRNSASLNFSLNLSNVTITNLSGSVFTDGNLQCSVSSLPTTVGATSPLTSANITASTISTDGKSTSITAMPIVFNGVVTMITNNNGNGNGNKKYSLTGTFSFQITTTVIRPPVLNYTPLIDATTFKNKFRMAFIKIKNNGTNVTEAIYVCTNTTGAFAPTVAPPLSTLPGTAGGPVTLLPPGSSFVLTITDPIMVYSIPIVTATTGSVATSLLNVQLELYFCVNGPEMSGNCSSKPVFLDTCTTTSGSCAEEITQSLFSSLYHIPQFFVAEIDNTGTCSTALDLTTDISKGPLNIFPSGFDGIVPTLLPDQCFILVSSDVSLLTSLCVSSPNSTVDFQASCIVKASIKTYYTVKSCSNETSLSSSLLVTGFGQDAAMDKMDKKQKRKDKKAKSMDNGMSMQFISL
jgi:hypothetical protein